MATPLKYWFKVPDSILWESWTDAELATVIRLQAYFNTRRARERLTYKQAARATLNLDAARLVCRRSRSDDCKRSLEALSELITCSVEAHSDSRGVSFEINWPKWADFQESKPGAHREQTRRMPSPKNQNQNQKKRGEKTREPAARPPRFHLLKAGQIERLRDLRPLGVLYAPGQVEAWFSATAPKMLAKGHKQLYRTAVNWFPRATPEEVEAAERWCVAENGRAYAEANPPEATPRFTPEQIAEAQAQLSYRTIGGGNG